MARKTAMRATLHKEADTRRLEEKLERGGQILPFGSPQLNTPAAISERLIEALTRGKTEKRGETLDRLWHAAFGQMTTGFSPAALAVAYTDWAAHLAMSPNLACSLAMDAHYRIAELGLQASCPPWDLENGCEPEDDRFHQRFKHEGWKKFPYNILAQAHLSAEDWWENLSRIRGMTIHHQDMLSFTRLLNLIALSPENYPLFNPAIQEKIFETRGMNFLKGMGNALEDAGRWWTGQARAGTEEYEVGQTIAATEGKVVFRNALFELIQYAPKTKKVYPEPVLIIPAWIMKYYILDLSPENSMVKYLVEQGHTVFMMSWKNPDARYRDVGFKDYLKEGALQAMDVVREIIPGQKIHAVGYCIGGTLLAMTMAHLANQKKGGLESATLFAAQVDFDEAGELMTFVDESQVTYLEDIMFSQGYLRGDQISAAFDLLKPRELIWQKMTQDYLLGERSEMFDLLAWNRDTTRLPYRMHSEYLRHLYLNNELSEGDFQVDDEVLDLDVIDTPMFVVSTEHDHIAPWKSVYKIHLLTDTEVTFVLANRGHNGGIVSEPGREGRTFRIGTRQAGGRYSLPKKWLKQHDRQDGSWWPAWHQWLAKRSGERVEPPLMGSKTHRPLVDAPGEYVHEH